MFATFRRRGSGPIRGASLLVVSVALILASPLLAVSETSEDSTLPEQVQRYEFLRERAANTERPDPDVARIGSREFVLDRAPVENPVVAEVGKRGTTSDWTPYTGTFGLEQAAHLLRRTVVGPTFDEMEAAVQDGLAQTVMNLLAPQFPPPLPGPWAVEPIPDVSDWTRDEIDSLITQYRIWDEDLRMWWTEGIIDAGPNVTETMTHFWHDHFATGMDKVFYPMSIYTQNALLRQHAVGNFQTLTRNVSKDPAMLLWLDNQYNYVGQINENFARELLELFTLGVDQYTQDDVVDVARAWTGYLTEDGITSIFVPSLHDDGLKTILGQFGRWDGDDVIDIVFQQDECARFICRKLYRWFIDEYPDEVLIEELAQTLRSNNYEIAPVLSQMLLSEHFFDTNYKGSVIRDGLDLYAGLPRSFGMADQIDLSDYLTIQAQWMRFSMNTYDHWLLDPPNVSGWDGYRTWVNSTTLPWRKALSVSLVDGEIFETNLAMQLDAIALANTFQNPDDPYLLIADLSTVLYGFQPTELVEQRMLDELLQGAEPWEWSIFDPDAESRIQGLIRLALRLPDSQIK